MEVTISNGKHGAIYKDESCLPDMPVIESLLSSGYKMSAGEKTLTKAEALTFAQKIKGTSKKKKLNS